MATLSAGHSYYTRLRCDLLVPDIWFFAIRQYKRDSCHGDWPTGKSKNPTPFRPVCEQTHSLPSAQCKVAPHTHSSLPWKETAAGRTSYLSGMVARGRKKTLVNKSPSHESHTEAELDDSPWSPGSTVRATQGSQQLVPGWVSSASCPHSTSWGTMQPWTAC